MAPRLKGKYTEEVMPAIMKEFAYKSVMQVPKIEKVIVHVT
ncbi:MAG TPA: 50S ribosomal protein L5, partial [Nitrospinae bacterium]|nr:50S ribosomal protein L5 [Nitrospinota bacterium]